MCKPWKVNGFRNEHVEGEKFSDHRRRLLADRETRVALGLHPVVDASPAP
jgi:hypothetical protein